MGAFVVWAGPPASAETRASRTYGMRSGGERHPRRIPKGDPLMSAQTGYLQVDANGVFPTALLLLVLVLAMLGVVAHAAFA